MGQLPAREWGGKGGGSLTTPSELGGPVLAWGHQGCPASISPGGGGRGARCPQQGVVPPPWAVGTGRSDFQRKSRGPGHQQVSSLGVGGAGRGARTPHPDHTPGCGTLQRPALHLAGTTLLWRQHAVVGVGGGLRSGPEQGGGGCSAKNKRGRVLCHLLCAKEGEEEPHPCPPAPCTSAPEQAGLPGLQTGASGGRQGRTRWEPPVPAPSRLTLSTSESDTCSASCTCSTKSESVEEILKYANPTVQK